MSEPVIKAKYRCAHCGPVAPEHFRDEVHVQASQGFYTRDDLVRAVAAALDYYSGVPTADIQREAEQTVDRLTKGET